MSTKIELFQIKDGSGLLQNNGTANGLEYAPFGTAGQLAIVNGSEDGISFVDQSSIVSILSSNGLNGTTDIELGGILEKDTLVDTSTFLLSQGSSYAKLVVGSNAGTDIVGMFSTPTVDDTIGMFMVDASGFGGDVNSITIGKSTTLPVATTKIQVNANNNTISSYSVSGTNITSENSLILNSSDYNNNTSSSSAIVSEGTVFSSSKPSVINPGDTYSSLFLNRSQTANITYTTEQSKNIGFFAEADCAKVAYLNLDVFNNPTTSSIITVFSNSIFLSTKYNGVDSLEIELDSVGYNLSDSVNGDLFNISTTGELKIYKYFSGRNDSVSVPFRNILYTSSTGELATNTIYSGTITAATVNPGWNVYSVTFGQTFDVAPNAVTSLLGSDPLYQDLTVVAIDNTTTTSVSVRVYNAGATPINNVLFNVLAFPKS